MLTPAGRVRLRRVPAEGGGGLPEAAEERIVRAFDKGRGHGVLHLGAAELGTALGPTLGFWRDLGQRLVAAACGALDPMDPGSFMVPKADVEELCELAAAVPPMRGAEFVDEGLLAEVWVDAGRALEAEAGRRKAGVQGFLEAHDSVWNVVGRVCFHLAENKGDPECPFAFIATYARQTPREAKLQYVPLGDALQEYAGRRRQLLALLAPLQRAAERSELIRELVDSGDVYHPLAWTPNEAHAFLSEVERFEQAGVAVRLPDWWNADRRRRPLVSVSVGGKSPSRLGVDAMLDLDVSLTLDGERLSKRDVRALLASSERLVLVKGKWVEVDADRLGEVMEHWREVQAAAGAEGVSFAQAMRLLAGGELEREEPHGTDGVRRDWSEVVAGRWLESTLEELRSPRIRRAIEQGAGLRAELRPYQKLGVEWLWTLSRLRLGGCLADDMGLGKTIQVIALLSLLRRGRGEAGTDLLVVPASLVENWRAELARFAPQLRVMIAHPSRIPTRQLEGLSEREFTAYDAVVTTYGTVLRSTSLKERDWRCVVLDEAQAIKNPSAKQTRAVKRLRARWKLALTGTPVENQLGDLWSIFDFLNPGLLGSSKEFASFCKALSAGKEGGYAFLRRLVRPYTLRRLKTDPKVISDLPEKTEVTAYCLLEKSQAVLYQASVDELKRALRGVDGIERRGVVLAFLTRFKQICNHPSQWLGDGEYASDSSGKFARLRELCEPIAARQEKVLVFTQFRELTGPLADLLARCFGNPGHVLHGGTAVRKRQQLVKEFQERDGIPFMVLSLKAGGTGLNLTAASHVVHFDRWWNPAVEDQATDRAFRIGQKRNVLVQKFVCKGTVEERIDELISSKKELADSVIGTGAPEARLTEMSNGELLSFVSLDLQSARGT